MRTLKRVRQLERSRLGQQGRSGFTLIEVIIALAIFMIGAVAIVRIFPPALAAVQGSGSRTDGSRLASSSLAKMNARIANSTVSSVPDAIYFGSSTGVYNTTFGGAFDGTAHRNQSLPRDARLAGNGNAANDSALKIGTAVTNSGSYIDGERQRVLKNDAGALFVLTNFPYNPGNIVPSVEDTVEGVRVKDYNGTIRYIFDFSNATLASTGQSWNYSATDPTYPQYPPVAGLGTNVTYYISYKWVDGNGRVHGVDEEPYSFEAPGASEPSGYVAPGKMRISLDTILADGSRAASDRPISIIPGEVSVRVVRKLTPTDLSDPDDGLRGVYVFSSGAGVAAGDTVRLSYQVSDWRNVVLDQSPDANSGTATLTTRGLDEDTYGDTVYALVYNAPDSSGDTKQSLRRSSCVPNSTGVCSATNDALANVEIGGSRTNRATLSATGKASLIAPRLRLTYRPQGGLGVQAAVAARTYTPYLDFVTPATYQGQPWREYSWIPGSSVVYFQPNEAGKIVVMTYEYQDGTGYHVAQDRVVTIGRDLQNVATAGVRTGFSGAGGKVAVAELTDLDGNPGPTVTAIQSVRGLSIQARAVWADNQGRYGQTVVTDYRKGS